MVARQALGVSSEHDEEAQLIARAQESDRAAWDEIFQRHYQRVYVFVFCRIGDAMAAEDVTADVSSRPGRASGATATAECPSSRGSTGSRTT